MPRESWQEGWWLETNLRGKGSPAASCHQSKEQTGFLPTWPNVASKLLVEYGLLIDTYFINDTRLTSGVADPRKKARVFLSKRKQKG